MLPQAVFVQHFIQILKNCDNYHYIRGLVLEEDGSIVEQSTRDSIAPIRSLTTLLAMVWTLEMSQRIQWLRKGMVKLRGSSRCLFCNTISRSPFVLIFSLYTYRLELLVALGSANSTICRTQLCTRLHASIRLLKFRHAILIHFVHAELIINFHTNKLANE